MPDNSNDFLGSVAGALTTFAFVPQVIKAHQTKSLNDLSLATLLTFMTGVALWIVYGAAIGSLPLVATNTVTLLLQATLIWMKVRTGR